MKSIDLQKVKPLASAIALAACAATSVHAQPLVSIGGSLNASALASVSSSFPALNANQAINIGYSGNAEISLPSGGDAVQSAIAEMASGSGSSESLPGLSDSPAPEGNGLSGLIEASVINDTAAAVTGQLAGSGMSAPGLDVAGSAVTSTTAELMAKLHGGEVTPPSDSEPSSDTPASEDEAPAPDTSALSNLPSADGMGGVVQASLVTDTAAAVTGQFSGFGGSVPGLDVAGSAVSNTTAELVARLQKGGSDASAPEGDNDASEPDAEEVTDEVASTEEPAQPEQPNPGNGLGSSEIAAALENRTRADAFVTMY